MIRLSAAFFVLFLGAVACVALLPNAPKIVRSRSAAAAQLHAEDRPAEAKPGIRVVYPAPSPDVEPDRPVQAADGRAAPAAAEAQPAPASVYPQIRSAASDAPIAPAPGNAAVLAGSENLNLNTASVEALNQIPGAGHIGRTIASHRPYRSVEDLLTKRVVRKSVYDRIKDQVAAE